MQEPSLHSIKILESHWWPVYTGIEPYTGHADKGRRAVISLSSFLDFLFTFNTAYEASHHKVMSLL